MQRHKKDEPLNEIYFHLLPFVDKSVVIMGCLKNRPTKVWEFITDFNKKDQIHSLKKISDLLICQVENWVCSPAFYKNYFKSREDEINHLVRISMKHPDERRSLDFNLFENLTHGR